MKIALIGYGKMGKAIDALAVSAGHEVSFRITSANVDEIEQIEKSNTDVVIEFTTPSTVVANIKRIISKDLPIVVGTTAWEDQKTEVINFVNNHKGAMISASNFSIGVNLFWSMNKKLASLMNEYPQYDVSMMEAHHLAKLDSPSGTAVTTANQIIENIDSKSTWKESHEGSSEELLINAIRQPEVKGTHLVKYTSNVDEIELKHLAKSRDGFAKGALIAAEWLIGKDGVFGMDEVLGL